MSRKFSLGSVLRGDVDECDLNDHWDLEYIYLIREGATVFYIGQTHDHFTDRLRSHCGLSWYGTVSELGQLIYDSAPDSLQWTVEFISFRDCMALVPQSAPVLESLWERGGYNTTLAIDYAEKFLIYAYVPCLNRQHNPFPSPLPPKYQALVDKREREKMRRIEKLLVGETP